MKVVHRTHTQNLLWDSAVGHDLAFQRARLADAALGEVLICEASSPGARIKAQLGEKAVGDVK